MIYESSKDYGTGEIIMLHEPPTSTQDVVNYLRDTHSQDVNDGDQIHFREQDGYEFYVNEASVTFIPANKPDRHGDSRWPDLNGYH